MLTKVLKRDGNTEEFQAYKIEDAIKKAFKSERVIYDQSVLQKSKWKFLTQKELLLLKIYKI